MQPVDYTTLMASCTELNRDWIPSRIEQVYQRDRFTISLALRTLKAKPWLTICWHPEAARINLGEFHHRALKILLPLAISYGIS